MTRPDRSGHDNVVVITACCYCERFRIGDTNLNSFSRISPLKFRACLRGGGGGRRVFVSPSRRAPAGRRWIKTRVVGGTGEEEEEEKVGQEETGVKRKKKRQEEKNLWHRLSRDRSIFPGLTDGIPEIPGRCLNGRFVPTSDPRRAQLLNNDVCAPLQCTRGGGGGGGRTRAKSTPLARTLGRQTAPLKLRFEVRDSANFCRAKLL